MGEPTLAERLGGRWAISLPGHVVGLMASLLLLANLVQRQSGGVHLPAVGVAFVMVFGFTASLDLVLHHTAFAQRSLRPVPAWWAVAKHTSAGLAVAASMWWVTEVVFAELVGPPLSAWFTLPALTLWGGSAVSVVADQWWRSAHTRTTLRDEAERLDLALRHQHAVAEEIIRSRAWPVTEEIGRLRTTLDDLAPADGFRSTDDGQEALRRVAKDLRGVSQGVVRSTSSDLWKQAERHLPRVTWRMQVLNTLRTQPFRPLVLITVGLIPVMFWEVEDLGLGRGGPLTLAGIATLWGVCTLANRVMARWPRWHMTVFVITVIILQIGQVAASALKNVWVPGYVPTGNLVVQMITGVLLIIFSSGWGTFWNLTQRRDAMFAERIGPDRERVTARGMAVAAAARSLAHDLHSGVQARMFACALALEEAADTGDLAQLNEALAATRALLDSPLATPSPETDLAAAVEAATQAWAGLCEITVTDHASPVDGVHAMTVRHVLEEGLVNAIRHGGARHVDVRLDRTAEGRVRVEVHDDGLATVTTSRRGLGSAIFDQLAPGHWGRSTDASGTLLWVELSANPTSKKEQ